MVDGAYSWIIRRSRSGRSLPALRPIPWLLLNMAASVAGIPICQRCRFPFRWPEPVRMLGVALDQYEEV